jgi:signal transduction histidine kinase
VGFAVVFALWIIWSYQLARGLEEIQRRVATAQETYVRGEQTLTRIRMNVLFGSIRLRDALIDGSSSRRDDYRVELIRLRDECDSLLNAYVPQVISVEEREQWARLQSELGQYWASREAAFSDTTDGLSASILRALVPHRENVLTIADQLAALQAAANERHRSDLDLLYSQVRRRLASTGAGTLIVALIVAVMVSTHVNGLQRLLERQRLSERQNRQDLERLSARLVDAQEQERRNLSRELHDAVGQALTAVKMDLGIALRAEHDRRVREALEDAREITETTLRGVRDLSQLLHPSTLDDFGLPATLTAYLRRFSQRTSIRAQLAETLEERLPPHVEVCVYRIVQEALNNIARHSAATACTVTLSAGSGALGLVIEDNGHGFAPAADAAASTRGLGLIAMRERAQALGGTFSIEESPSGGVRVSVTIPLGNGATFPLSHDAADAPEVARDRLAG